MDIIDQLRNPQGSGAGSILDAGTMAMAAKEIERLRGAIQFIRDKCHQNAGNTAAPFAYVWQRCWEEFERMTDEETSSDPPPTDDRPKAAINILRVLCDSDYLAIPNEFREMIHHELAILSEAIEAIESEAAWEKVRRMHMK